MMKRFITICSVKVKLHYVSFFFQAIMREMLWIQVWQFSPGFSHCSTDKIDRHDIIKILLKVAFNTKNTISQVKRIDSWVNIGTCKYSHFQGLFGVMSGNLLPSNHMHILPNRTTALGVYSVSKIKLITMTLIGRLKI
jgi:hypothetical protein